MNVCPLHGEAWCSCPRPRDPSTEEITRHAQKLIDAVTEAETEEFWKDAIVKWPDRFLHTKDCNVHSPKLSLCSCCLDTRLKDEIKRLNRALYERTAELDALAATRAEVGDTKWRTVAEPPLSSGWYMVWTTKMPDRLHIREIPSCYYSSSAGEWDWIKAGKVTHWAELLNAPCPLSPLLSKEE